MNESNKQGGAIFNIFRITSVLEGLSFIILLAVGMPLKYMYGDESMVKLAGPIHGGLFTLYCVMAIWLKSDLKWSNKTTFQVLILSIIPFGMVYAELKIFRTK